MTIFIPRHFGFISLHKVGHSFVAFLFKQHLMHTQESGLYQEPVKYRTASSCSLDTLQHTPKGDQNKVLIKNTREQFSGSPPGNALYTKFLPVEQHIAGYI